MNDEENYVVSKGSKDRGLGIAQVKLQHDVVKKLQKILGASDANDIVSAS